MHKKKKERQGILAGSTDCLTN